MELFSRTLRIWAKFAKLVKIYAANIYAFNLCNKMIESIWYADSCSQSNAIGDKLTTVNTFYYQSIKYVYNAGNERTGEGRGGSAGVEGEQKGVHF